MISVPCTHKDKQAMHQSYIVFFSYSNNRNFIFHCLPFFNYMKNISLSVEFRRIEFQFLLILINQIKT